MFQDVGSLVFTSSSNSDLSEKFPQFIQMQPNEDAFMSLGFGFNTSKCEIVLPQGWSFVTEPDKSWTYFYDAKHRPRGSSRYSGQIYTISLVTKYYIDISENPYDKTSEYLVKDGGCAIHSAKCKRNAEDYLDENFPDWKDPMKYWD